MRYLYHLCCFSFFMVAGSVNADQFCFALAETYYEQVYCQLQAKAQTKNLPPFNQFKKNNEQVQASLLKRPAERNGIKLPLPAFKTSSPAVKQSVTEKTPAHAISLEPAHPARLPSMQVTDQVLSIQTNVPQHKAPLAENVFGCELQAKQLHCANGVFILTGNKSNQRLVKAALSTGNTMALPAYDGGAINVYLTRAYQQYIVKMCEIGLCGVTMTYGKFSYLFQDIKNKGLDFTQRFETMYGFLKKDKTNMGVSEAVSTPQELVSGDCSPLGDTYYVCEKQGRNFIFVRQ